MREFVYLLLVGIMLGGIYSLAASGMVLVYKSTRVFNLAQGGILMLGGYVLWGFQTHLALPLWLSFTLLVGFATLLGYAINHFTMRPLIGQSTITALLVTLVLTLLFEGAAVLVWMGDPKAYEPPFVPREPLVWGSITIAQEYLWCFAATIFFLTLLALFFRFTKRGIVMKAVAEDHLLSQSAGISVDAVFRHSWIIASLLAVFAGVLIASLREVSVESASIGLLKAVPVVLLGGLESFLGALVGGLIIGVTEMLTAGYLDPLVGGGLSDIVPLLIMLVILIVKPYGFFGMERIERI